MGLGDLEMVGTVVFLGGDGMVALAVGTVGGVVGLSHPQLLRVMVMVVVLGPLPPDVAVGLEPEPPLMENWLV